MPSALTLTLWLAADILGYRPMMLRENSRRPTWKDELETRGSCNPHPFLGPCLGGEHAGLQSPKCWRCVSWPETCLELQPQPLSPHLCPGLRIPVLGTPGGPPSPSLGGGSSAGSGRPGQGLALGAPFRGRAHVDATQGGVGSGGERGVSCGGREPACRGRPGPGEAQRGGRAREGCEQAVGRRESGSWLSWSPSPHPAPSQPQRRVSLCCVSLSLQEQSPPLGQILNKFSLFGISSRLFPHRL